MELELKLLNPIVAEAGTSKLRDGHLRRIWKVKKRMSNTRTTIPILRDFYEYDGPRLVIFGTNTSVNVDPLQFPGLPFAPKDIKALADDLNLKLAATITGGTVETAAKNAAFATLANALNANANVVEIGAGLNLEKLLATGYLPASSNRSQSPLDDTAIVGLWNNGTGKVLLQLLRVLNARAYQVQTSTDGGKTWVEACVPSTRPGRIVLTGLMAGARRMPCRHGPSAAARARASGAKARASCPPEQGEKLKC
jgi:hypothetical protein